MNKEIETKLRIESLAMHVLLSAIEGNFDVWRENYGLLDINDLIWINSGIHNFVGSQEHFNYEGVKDLIDIVLNRIPELAIIELGCWKGHLAKRLLSEYTNKEVKSYVGYDINYPAIDQSVVDDLRYTTIKMTDWFQNYKLDADILISCHTIEHMNEEQIRKIMIRINELSLKYLIFELPFNYKGLWNGGNNSHILKLNSEEFVKIMEEYGFKLFTIIDTTRETREKIYNQWLFGLERIR